MPKNQEIQNRTIRAVRVCQWLPEWDAVEPSPAKHRRAPEHHFYLFSLSATELKALSGVYRRSLDKPRSQDLGIQRAYEKDRSDEIREFIRWGWPWSEIASSKRKSAEFAHLRKPGWLPTAIVVNLLTEADRRRDNARVASDDIVQVEDRPDGPVISLPQSFSGPTWQPKQLPPLEVIDGQHRLLAFEDISVDSSYELPVVAFHGLDLSWQAYLFWTINIKPKRINASFAFDLYPMLRTEDWLERFEGPSIYRETRAQELTEALWSHPESPWHNRINMLGETGLHKPMVSQAAWIRSLMATYVKTWETRRGLGGLFGSSIGTDVGVLRWNRAQQAAFLIFIGKHLQDAIGSCRESWAESLRGKKRADPRNDPAMFGVNSLLATDQGVRGFLFVTNDLFYNRADDLKLDQWEFPVTEPGYDAETVTGALASLRKLQAINAFAVALSDSLARYDWRTSSSPGLEEDERTRKAGFRGSGGYKELRRHVLQHLSKESKQVGDTAKRVLQQLNY